MSLGDFLIVKRDNRRGPSVELALIDATSNSVDDEGCARKGEGWPNAITSVRQTLVLKKYLSEAICEHTPKVGAAYTAALCPPDPAMNSPTASWSRVQEPLRCLSQPKKLKIPNLP
jgi:hypothetical protein